jgi:hypothetical protein
MKNYKLRIKEFVPDAQIIDTSGNGYEFLILNSKFLIRQPLDEPRG